MNETTSPPNDDQFTGLWSDKPATADDVAKAYRLFLGRDPESEEVVRQLVDLPRWRLIAAFMTSDEFIGKLGPMEHGKLVSLNDALLAEPGVGLLFWGWALIHQRMVPGINTRLPLFATMLRDGQFLAKMMEDAPGQSELLLTTANAIDGTLIDIGVIRDSELFDPDYYAAQTEVGAAADLAEHYLLAGESLFLRPSPLFDPLGYELSNKDARDSHANLLLHYEESGRTQNQLPASSTILVPTKAQLDLVRDSELFDEHFYLAQLASERHRIRDAALHYLMVGEARGYSPSSLFNPLLYGDLHPDIATSNVNRLLHYLTFGKDEGRPFRSYVSDLQLLVDDLDPAKPTILLLLHEATHTGAPILGWNLIAHLRQWNNVVTAVRDGGSLDAALLEASSALVGPLPSEIGRDEKQLLQLARRLAQVYQPTYVIANSYESRMLALALRECGVPVVALIHEFAMGQRLGVRSDFYARCSAIIFPAHLVRRSAARAFREIGLQNTFVLPQGQSMVPPFARKAPVTRSGLPGLIQEEEDENTLPALSTILNEETSGVRPFTVIGLGTAELRKGIDLFVATASALARRDPELAVRFVWIGDWSHVKSTPYGDLLVEQVNRSQLGDRLHFFSATDNLDVVYDRADALLLSSRIDPLPNVCIDAAMRQIPIVCFAEASGLAELMSDRDGTAHLVVPHLDTSAAADQLHVLATDQQLYRRSADAIATLAIETFDMARYTRCLHEIGTAAAAKFAALSTEASIIVASNDLDYRLFFGAVPTRNDPAAAAVQYLDATRQINFASPPVWGVGLARPMAGFHPFIYGTEAPDYPADGSRDPLAHFLEKGRPGGRWSHPVIRLAQPIDRTPPRHRGLVARLLRANLRPSGAETLRVALHGHFHYTDNVADFLACLSANAMPMDLFLTTTTSDAHQLLEESTRSYRNGRVMIFTFPNVGRDVYPFLRVLRDYVAGHYDWVGHIHGKRSVHTFDFDKSLGDRWRTFLWEHLLGPTYAAADIIRHHAALDPKLGLVFPENDITIAWEKNADIGHSLAEQLNLALPLPSHIDFPVGTMFWARPEALTKLVTLGLAPEDYPVEPLPIDGTLLHALERLLPLVCENAGYRFATTYIPHVRR